MGSHTLIAVESRGEREGVASWTGEVMEGNIKIISKEKKGLSAEQLGANIEKTVRDSSSRITIILTEDSKVCNRSEEKRQGEKTCWRNPGKEVRKKGQ